MNDFMSQYYDARTTKLIYQLTKLVLENNIIEFNGELYLQLVGCAMGSKMSPNYANVFMHHFEKTYLPQAPVQPYLWKRYIDDIFAIFVCSDQEIQAFIEWINGVHPSIKFTTNMNPNGVPFLDCFVKIENNSIITKPYTKPTDKKQYIHPSSCHPPHVFRSIPYSQALRIKRICTKEQDLMAELQNLEGYFKNRGYPVDIIHAGFNKALLPPQNYENNEEDDELDKRPTVMVIPYHPLNPTFAKCIATLWQDHELILKDKIKKPIVAYTRPRNLKEILTRARYGPPAIPTPPINPGSDVINRPISTYDRNQLKAPVKHILFKCSCNHEICDEFNTLEEALYSQKWKRYQAQHVNCTNFNVLPVQVEHKSHVSCTECNYHHQIISNKTVRRVQDEIMHSMDTINSALFRSKKLIKACSLKCNTCLMQNYDVGIKDNKGCHYNYLPFECTAKFVIYIIQCKLCNQNYVGQTTSPIKSRISAHLSNIRKFKNTSIAKHFNSPGHIVLRDFKIGIIDCISPSRLALNIREATWISQLNTIASGINEKDEARLSLEYQTLAISHHFKHSRTCLPKITSRVREVSTLNLQYYKRIAWVRTLKKHPR
jgi:peptide-methionine (R)-S-oxide reductase